MSKAAARTVAERLRAGDFYNATHRTIYGVVSSLVEADRPVDLLTVEDALNQAEGLRAPEGGWKPIIGRLENAVPTAAHVDDYALRVLDPAMRRQLIDLARKIDAQARAGEADLDSLMEEAHLSLERVSARRFQRELKGGVTAAELAEMNFDPLRWVVDGLFGEGLCLLVGKGKQGKSWMMYQIAVAVALGGVALGSISVEPGRVLYLALEDPLRRLKDRLKRITGEEKAPERLHLYTRWPRMHEGGQRKLMAWFRQHPDTRLVIIDTFAKVRSISERPGNAYDEDYRAMSEIKEVADAHGATVVVVHHFNKMRQVDDWVDSVSGSIGISGAADGIVGFFRERAQPAALLKVTGRDIVDESDRPMKWVAPGGPWLLTNESPEEMQRTQAERKVIEWMRDRGRPARPVDVFNGIGGNRENVRSLVWRMGERGILVPHEDGWYSLSATYAETKETLFSETDATEKQCNSATGCDSVAGVAAVASVAGVALTTEFGDPPPPEEPLPTLDLLPEPLKLPEGMPAEEAQERRRCFDLAAAHGWRALEFPGSPTIQGEGKWRSFCGTAALAWVERAYGRLME